MSVCLRWAG